MSTPRPTRLGAVLTTFKSSHISRIIDMTAVGLCILSVISVPAIYGRLAFGQVAFYVSIQSAALHFVRIFGYEFPITVRYANAGLALGICLTLHAFTRGFHGDSYLHYVGGTTLDTLGHRYIVGLVYAAVPLVSVVHVWMAPLVNVLLPMLVAATELAVIVLLHNSVSNDQARQILPEQQVMLYTASVVSVMAWILLLETMNRFFLPQILS